MKIAHVQHPYIPENSYQENYLPYHQKELGHDVIIYTSNTLPSFVDSDSIMTEKGACEYKGVTTNRLPVYNVERLQQVWLKGLFRHLDEFSPDIIHSHGLLTLKSLQTFRYANKKESVKIYYDSHIDNGNLNIDNTSKRFLYWGYKSVARSIATRSDGVFGVNPQAIQHLGESIGIPENKITYLPLGVDINQFHPSNNLRATGRDRLRIDESVKLGICVGNLNNTKNITDIIKALNEVSDSRFKVLLLGKIRKDYLDECIKTCHQEGVRDNIIFHERVPHEELPVYYNAADVGIWAGKLGVSAIEAVACGLPVIVTKSKATNFLVQNNGMKFEEGNISSLADKISTYTRKPGKLTEHGMRSRELAVNKLNWRKIASKSLQVYESDV